METLINWIHQQLNTRGWSVPEIARRSKQGGYEGVSASMIYKVLNEYARPGPKFFEGIARAFGVKKEDVMRMAGKLAPESPKTGRRREADYLFTRLTDEDQETMLIQLRALAEQRASYETTTQSP